MTQNEIASETRASFSADPAEFHAAAKFLASKLVERRNTVPILSAIMLEAHASGFVTLTGTDRDIWGEIAVAAAVEAPGKLCVDARALTDALATAKKDRECARVGFAHGETGATITARRATYKLHAMPTADFPLPGPIGETDGTLSAKFSAPAFLADLRALQPCVSTEQTRFYLNGWAMQIRDIAGRSRMITAATDGWSLGAASRAIPAGIEAMPDIIFPRKLGEMLLASAKLFTADSLAFDVENRETAPRVALQLGALRLIGKTIYGTFPNWQLPFETHLAPIGETGEALFPDMMPGTPIGVMEKIAKAVGAAVEWSEASQGRIAAVPSDPDLVFGCINLVGDLEPKKGFHIEMNGRGEAKAYLEALASSRGLPDVETLHAAAQSEAWRIGRETFVDETGREWQRKACAAREMNTYEQNGQIVGLTVSAWVHCGAWLETVSDWETLADRTIEHPACDVVAEGSYSLLMPADGPQLEAAVSVSVEGDRTYPLGVNAANTVHVSAEQVARLCGDDLFQTVEFTGPDGRPRYVLAWEWADSGKPMLATVQANGRTFADRRKPGAQWKWETESDVERFSRADIEAALAGEGWVAPSEEIAPAAPIEAIGEAESKPARGETSPGPLWKGKSWGEALCRNAQLSATAFECHDGAVSMITNERAGNYRTRIPARYQRAAKALFNAQLQAVARGEINYRWAELPKYGPDAHSAPLSAKTDTQGAVTPAEPDVAPSEAVADASEQSAPVADAPPVVKTAENSDPVADVAPVADLMADVLARLEAIEARLALSVESAVTPSSEIAQPKRTAAHERAIRRAWAERKRIGELESAMLNACNNQRDSNGEIMRLKTANADLEERNASMTELADKLNARRHQAEGERDAANGRALMLEADLAEARNQADAARARAADLERIAEAGEKSISSLHERLRTAEQGERETRIALEAARMEIASIRKAMADPSCPERPSDVARLVQERDQARHALAAMAQRAERAEKALQDGADKLEALAKRVFAAERQLAATAAA